jgi:hypothetical protein
MTMADDDNDKAAALVVGSKMERIKQTAASNSVPAFVLREESSDPFIFRLSP